MRWGLGQRPLVVGVPFQGQAELFRDPLGGSIALGDDGDQPVDAEDVAGVVAAGGRGFGGQARPWSAARRW